MSSDKGVRRQETESESSQDTRLRLSQHILDHGHGAGGDRVVRASDSTTDRAAFRRACASELNEIRQELQGASGAMRNYNLLVEQGRGRNADLTFAQACDAYMHVIQRASRDLLGDGRQPASLGASIHQERGMLAREITDLQQVVREGRPLSEGEMRQLGVNNSDARRVLQDRIQDDMTLKDLERSLGYAEANFGLALIRSAGVLPGNARAEQIERGQIFLMKASQDDPYMMGPPPDPNFMKHYTDVMRLIEGGNRSDQPQFPQPPRNDGPYYPPQGPQGPYDQPTVPRPGQGGDQPQYPVPGQDQPPVSRSSAQVFRDAQGQTWVADAQGFTLPSGNMRVDSPQFQNPFQVLQQVEAQARQPLTPQDIQNFQAVINLADRIDRVTLRQQMDQEQAFLQSRLNDQQVGPQLRNLLTQEDRANADMSRMQSAMAQMIPGLTNAGGQAAADMLNRLRQFNNVNDLIAFERDPNNKQAIDGFKALGNGAGAQFLSILEQFNNNKAIIGQIDTQINQVDPNFLQTRELLNKQSSVYHSSEDARAHLLRALVSNPQNQTQDNMRLAQNTALQLGVIDQNLLSDQTFQQYAGALGLRLQDFQAVASQLQPPRQTSDTGFAPGSGTTGGGPTRQAMAQNDTSWPPPNVPVGRAGQLDYQGPNRGPGWEGVTNGPIPLSPNETTVGSLAVSQQSQAALQDGYNLLAQVKKGVPLSQQMLQGPDGQPMSVDGVFRQLVAATQNDVNGRAVAQALYAAALLHTGDPSDKTQAVGQMQSAMRNPNLETLYPPARALEIATNLSRQTQPMTPGMPGYVPQDGGYTAPSGTQYNPQAGGYQPGAFQPQQGFPQGDPRAGQPQYQYGDNTGGQQPMDPRQAMAMQLEQLKAKAVPGYMALLQANQIMGDTQHSPQDVVRAAGQYFEQAIKGGDQIDLKKVQSDFVGVGQQLQQLQANYESMNSQQLAANPAMVQQMQQQAVQLSQKAEVLDALRSQPTQARLLYAVALNHAAAAMYEQAKTDTQHKDQLTKDADEMNAHAVNLLKEAGQKDPTYGGKQQMELLVKGAIDQASRHELINEKTSTALGLGQMASQMIDMGTTPFGATGARPLTVTANLAGQMLGMAEHVPLVGNMVGGFSHLAPDSLFGNGAAQALAEAKNIDPQTGKKIVERGQLISKDGLVHGGIDLVAGPTSVYLADKVLVPQALKLVAKDIPADGIPGLALKLGASWLVDATLTKTGDVAAHHLLGTTELTNPEWLSHSTASWGATWAVKGASAVEANLASKGLQQGAVDQAAGQLSTRVTTGLAAEGSEASRLAALNKNLGQVSSEASEAFGQQIKSQYRFYDPRRYFFGKANVAIGEDGGMRLASTLTPEELAGANLTKVSKSAFLADQMGIENGARFSGMLNPKNMWNGFMQRPLAFAEDGTLNMTARDIGARQFYGRVPWIALKGGLAGGAYSWASVNPTLTNPETGKPYTWGETVHAGAVNAGWGAGASVIAAPVAPWIGKQAYKLGIEWQVVKPFNWFANAEAGAIVRNEGAAAALSPEARAVLNEQLTSMVSESGRKATAAEVASVVKNLPQLAAEQGVAFTELTAEQQAALTQQITKNLTGFKAAISIPANQAMEAIRLNSLRRGVGGFVYESIPNGFNRAINGFSWGRMATADAMAEGAGAMEAPTIGQRATGFGSRLNNYFMSPDSNVRDILNGQPGVQNYFNNLTRVYARPFTLQIGSTAASGYGIYQWHMADKQSDEVIAKLKEQAKAQAAQGGADPSQQRPNPYSGG